MTKLYMKLILIKNMVHRTNLKVLIAICYNGCKITNETVVYYQLYDHPCHVILYMLSSVVWFDSHHRNHLFFSVTLSLTLCIITNLIWHSRLIKYAQYHNRNHYICRRIISHTICPYFKQYSIYLQCDCFYYSR